MISLAPRRLRLRTGGSSRWTRACCLLLAVTLLGGGCGPDERTPPVLRELRRQLPVRAGTNVLVVTFDALRADALGAYGNTRRTSPNLDAFAAGSLVFENAYSVAPVTPTSFAAAFSGMLPSRVFRAWHFEAEKTIAEHFKERGYTTAAFLNNIQLTPERSFDRGFQVYELAPSEEDDLVLERALAWLADHRDERYFAWIHFLVPHAPYVYRDSARHLYDASYRGPFEWSSGVSFTPESPADIARVRSLYDGNVFHADQIFGWLMDGLRRLGVLDSALLIVSSDHGEELFEHGGFQHGRLTEEHVRIPLLIRHPDARAAGRTPVLFANVDLLPTVMAIAGLPPPKAIDGRNLLAVDRQPEMLASLSMTSAVEQLASLRRGQRKLILYCAPEERRELFDLGSDPLELRNLAAREVEAVRRHERELGIVLGGPPCAVLWQAMAGADPTARLDAESVKALKALGYL